MKAIEFLKGHWRIAALTLSCFAGIAAGMSGVGVGGERALREAGWHLRQHPASGQIHIVEIDARSIGAIDKWPWPRSNYARLIDRLREAGAASILFDVDFSSQSPVPDEDAAFAAALDRAEGKVVLPTFGQEAGGGQEGWTDSLPTAQLREHATLAAVSILPDADGYVRRAPLGTMTDGLPRPSLSAMIAGMDGTADQDFPIDFAIDPNTIPRHSFIDIRDGSFDSRAIAGKDVVIGATAVEMGDRYAVPNYGVIPGVVIQALATETLRRGLPREAGWPLPLVLAALLGWTILRMRTRQHLAAATLASPVILFATSALADAAGHWLLPMIPAFITITSASGLALATRATAAARRRRMHDAGTGLPNRLALREAMRSYAGIGVVTAHLAEFDKLAAGLPASAITELVRRVRDRIALVSEGSTVYRVEDRVLAWRCYDEEALESRLASLRSAMLAPVEIGGRRVDVTLAIGFASEAAAASPDRCVANAALAAQRAMASGGRWHVHDAGEDETIERELSLLGELDEAIGKGEIHLVYQPKLDLRSGRIASVEALVRWHHGTRGFLRPDLFIPLAERNDRIAALTLHVVAETIADLRRWHALGHRITGAVNLSVKLLSSAEFIAMLRELIRTSGIEPDALTFEVTESAAMHDPEAAVAALHLFRDLGIAISMDDYGTGQSTLSYLKQLPLNELKIDRSFVQFAHQNRGDGVLVRSTVELAHDLGLKVVAEGAEDQECLAFLRSIGCDLVQGYVISRPVPAAELEALLPRSFDLAA
ncbi:EAL domain-containing protein [Sphingomonas sp. NIBR02145]|uniref:putative bifunctional diguanylate cyclase/phosphodiesterase n=1 Tax=Sphingomonas sp. NIBR02145 TaxID=3014784 RepID=UPI0022B535CA|nr:EAL domain-containing protein [Sphingomonas sp. NIBR02145]WHU02369.1 EAL domain-containing protein [Sphingomonas sp. NIBR02145]